VPQEASPAPCPASTTRTGNRVRSSDPLPSAGMGGVRHTRVSGVEKYSICGGWGGWGEGGGGRENSKQHSSTRAFTATCTLTPSNTHAHMHTQPTLNTHTHSCTPPNVQRHPQPHPHKSAQKGNQPSNRASKQATSQPSYHTQTTARGRTQRTVSQRWLPMYTAVTESRPPLLRSSPDTRIGVPPAVPPGPRAHASPSV
jgi:hypothetical protein